MIENKNKLTKKKLYLKNIDYISYGEQVSRFFLKQNQICHNHSIIKSMLINNTETFDQGLIAEHLNYTYKNIFNQVDPYIEGNLETFLGEEGLSLYGKISEEDKLICDSPYTFPEMEHAIKKIGNAATAGHDHVTGKLLHHIFPYIKYLICGAIKEISSPNTNKRVNYRSLIFLPKNTSYKDYKMV